MGSESMNFELVEHYFEGKSIHQKSEDVLFWNKHFFAVYDGATSKTTSATKVTPSREIVEIAASTLSKLPADIKFAAAVKKMNESIRSIQATNVHSRSDAIIEKPSASLAIISSLRNELWLLGDCQALVDGQEHKYPKLIDTTNATFRAAVNQLALQRGKSIEWLRNNDIGRDAILPVLTEQTVFQNVEKKSMFAYGALDGSAEALSYLKIIDISAAEEVVIASDGYTKLFSNLKDSEEHLESLLKRDPMMIYDFVQTKGMSKGNISFDDRAYLKVRRVTPE